MTGIDEACARVPAKRLSPRRGGLPPCLARIRFARTGASEAGHGDDAGDDRRHREPLGEARALPRREREREHEDGMSGDDRRHHADGTPRERGVEQHAHHHDREAVESAQGPSGRRPYERRVGHENDEGERRSPDCEHDEVDTARAERPRPEAGHEVGGSEAQRAQAPPQNAAHACAPGLAALFHRFTVAARICRHGRR